MDPLHPSHPCPILLRRFLDPALGWREQSARDRRELVRPHRAVYHAFPLVRPEAREDASRQLERLRPGLAADAGRVPRAQAADEIVEFARQLVALVALGAIDIGGV